MEVYVDAHEVTDLAHEMLHHVSTVRGLTRAAIRKAGYGIQASAQRRAPVDTGHLRASISTDFDEDLGFEVGPTAEYGGYVELGVPHPFTITAAPGHMLRFVVDGQVVFAHSVTHPPSAPNPYLAPAFDEFLPVIEEAVAVIGELVIVP